MVRNSDVHVASELDLNVTQVTLGMHGTEGTNTVDNETFVLNRSLESLQAVPYCRLVPYHVFCFEFHLQVKLRKRGNVNEKAISTKLVTYF